MKSKEEWAESVKSPAWYELDIAEFARAIQADALAAAAKACAEISDQAFNESVGRLSDSARRGTADECFHAIKQLIPPATPPTRSAKQ